LEECFSGELGDVSPWLNGLCSVVRFIIDLPVLASVVNDEREIQNANTLVACEAEMETSAWSAYSAVLFASASTAAPALPVLFLPPCLLPRHRPLRYRLECEMKGLLPEKLLSGNVLVQSLLWQPLLVQSLRSESCLAEDLVFREFVAEELPLWRLSKKLSFEGVRRQGHDSQLLL